MLVGRMLAGRMVAVLLLVAACGSAPPLSPRPTGSTPADGSPRSLDTARLVLRLVPGTPLGKEVDRWVTDIAVGEAGIVAVGASGARPLVWHSAEGETWSAGTLPGSVVEAGPPTVAAGPSGFLIAVETPEGTATWHSTDGRAWRTAEPPPLLSILDATGWGERWVIVGEDATERAEEVASAIAFGAPAGDRWDVRTEDARCCAVHAAGTFRDRLIVTGATGGPEQPDPVLLSTADGERWERADPTSGLHEAVGLRVLGTFASESRAVALGLDEERGLAHTWWSTDGRDWRRGTVEGATDEEMVAATDIPGGFVGVGTSGRVWATADGRVWRVVHEREGDESAPYSAVVRWGDRVVVVENRDSGPEVWLGDARSALPSP